MSSVEPVVLNNEWKLYFHDPNNANWTIDSYVTLDTIKSVNEWVLVFKSFKNTWSNGMFFLMRENIQPLWEDKLNKNGGCLSFKLFKTEVNEYWFDLSAKIIGESILDEKNPHWNKINGISISPKRSHCVIRIWLCDDILKDTSLYNFKVPSYSKMIYKSHSDNKDYAH
jgi:hypothetical protein